MRTKRGLEGIIFADGTRLSRSQVRDLLLTSTAANETFTGFGGNDTFTYARGGGNDIMVDGQWSGGGDTLRFTDINPADVKVSINGNDFVLTIPESAPGAGDAGSVTLRDSVNDNNQAGLEYVTFANGTTWSRTTMRNQSLIDAATDGNDTIYGFNSDDTLSGGKGNDTLNGGAGNDVYRYSRGDGNDTIVETDWNGSYDRLVFTDINRADVTFSYSGNDLTVHVTESSPGEGDGGSILLANSVADGNGAGVEAIIFADGSSLSRSQWRDIVLTSTSADETFTGFGGNDTYRYARGGGNDVIYESQWSGNDTLLLTDINPDDVWLTNNGNDLIVHVAASSSATGGSITLKDSVSDNYYTGVEYIKFANGTVWSRSDFQVQLSTLYGTPGDDEITGTGGADKIEGLGGSDLIWGGAGSDTYIYRKGDGSDEIAEDTVSSSDVDVLKLVDLNLSDLSFSRSSGDLTISVNGTSDTISIYWQFQDPTQYSGLEKILFANGMTADLYHGDTAWKLNGTDGNDEISSPLWGQSEIFEGGKGNDYLYGSAGSDTYVYSSGDGSDEINDDVGFTDAGNVDVLKLKDLNQSDISLERSGDNLLVHIIGTGDVITVDNQFISTTQNFGIERIDFTDGTSLDRANFIASPPASPKTGTAGDDELTGTSGNDVMDGGLGNDLMWGQGGSDAYVYRLGDGSDQIAEDNTSPNDVDVLDLVDLNLSDLSFSRSAGDLMMSMNGTSDTISIYWQFQDPSQYSGLEKILFANGMTADLYHGDVAWKLNGTAGDDQISSPLWGQSEIFNGGKGNDYLYGSAGSDTYLYASGDGSDEINDDVGFTDAGNVDVLKFTDLNQSDISMQRDGDNLLVNVNSTGDVITIDSQFISTTQNFGIESIEFADGTSLDRSAIESGAPSISTNALRTAMATSSVSSAPDDHVDQRPIELGALTFTLAVGDDTREVPTSATNLDTPTGEDSGIELSYWSTSSDSYEDSQTMADLHGLDSNGDNVLDINDVRWGEFQVWRDSNANGLADAGEVQSMSEAGIKLVSLLPSQGSDAFADTTSTAQTAAGDGAKYLLGDATFASSRLDRTANAA